MSQLNTQEINLTVNVDDANKILAGLAELPAKVSIDLIMRIKSEAEKQLSIGQQMESAQPAGQQLLTEDE